MELPDKRAGNLDIIAGPCQFLPAMSEDRRSFAWTAYGSNLHKKGKANDPVYQLLNDYILYLN